MDSENYYPLLIFGSIALIGLIAILTVEIATGPTQINLQNNIAGQATGTYDVVLASEEPVYTAADVRFSTLFYGYEAFHNIDWQDGRFVIAGECSSANGGKWEGYGMYLLSAEGEHLYTRDVCYDTATKSGACNEGGGCSVGVELIPYKERYVVRDTNPTHWGRSRSPTVYEISSDRLLLHELIFFNDGGFQPPEEEGQPLVSEHIAVANDVMIASENVYYGFTEPVTGYPLDETQPAGYRNGFYSLPDLQFITDWKETGPRSCSRGCSGAPSLYHEKVQPLVGVGEYFLARPRAEHSKLNVYRMPTIQELQDGKKPEFVQTLYEERVSRLSYTLDTRNRERIAIARDDTLEIFVAGENGLEKETSRTYEGGHHIYQSQGLALSGPYLAYSTCTEQNGRTCELVVESEGEELTVQPIPWPELGNERSNRIIPEVSISPDGTMLVVARGEDIDVGSRSYGPDKLFLYRIVGADGSGTPASPETPEGYAPYVDPITEEEVLWFE